MRRLLQLVSWAALLGTVVPSALYLTGAMQLPQVKLVMLVSTIAWFASTPFWMGRMPKTKAGGQKESTS